MTKEDLKIGIEQCESLLREMNRLKQEYPKANIYFDGEEIRISYPLPRDFHNMKRVIFQPQKR